MWRSLVFRCEKCSSRKVCADCPAAGRLERVYEQHDPHAWYEGASKALPSVPAAPPDRCTIDRQSKAWPRTGRHPPEFARHAIFAPTDSGRLPDLGWRHARSISTGFGGHRRNLPPWDSILRSDGNFHPLRNETLDLREIIERHRRRLLLFLLRYPPSTTRQSEHGLFPSNVLLAASTIPTCSARSTSIPVHATV